MSALQWRLVRRVLPPVAAAARHSTAAHPVPQPDPDSRREQTESFLRETERMARVAPRTRPRRPQRPPFAKGLFVGRFDAELLAYPELEKEDADRLEEEVKKAALPVEEAEAGAKEVKEGDVRGLVRRLAEHGLVGLQAPRLLGGREMTVTESCRLLEGTACHAAAPGALASEWLGVQALVRFGDDSQKARYLPGLLSGETVAAFGLLEDRAGGGPEGTCTTAKREPGADAWILNGEKIWVLNGNCADVFVVLAETGRIVEKGMEHAQVTAFIVDRQQQGVSVARYPLAGHAPDMAYLRLADARLPAHQVLGAVDGGRAIIQELMPQFRLACSVPPMVLTRTLLDHLTRFCIESSPPSTSGSSSSSSGASYSPPALYETDEVLTLAGRLAMRVYAMESLVYFTAGLMDQYEGQDCELEAALTRAFNAEQARRAAEACLHFVGTSALLKDHWCSDAIRDTLKYVALQESQDGAKMMSALMGLQHAGAHLQDTVAKLRNPLFNAGFVLRRLWSQRRQRRDDPRPRLGLDGHLHPSLSQAASRLEYVAARLQFAVEVALARHGGAVVNRHADLAALAECAGAALAMTACAGRASRAYCIGLRHSSHDLLLADAFCTRAAERVRRLVARLDAGDVVSTNESLRQAAGTSFKEGRYFAEHPLTRNF